MFEHTNLTKEAYLSFLEEHGGEECEAVAFAALVKPIAERFCNQNNLPPLEEYTLDEFSQALWDIAQETGMAAALPKGEKGEPKCLEPDEQTELMTEILDRVDTEEGQFEIAHMGKYFLAAMVQPEFSNCRLSYCKANEEGKYPRQDLAYCKKRISGSHCVDCPLFIQTEPENHPQILQMQWKAMDDSDLHDNLGVFIPEDFRQFRYFLHLYRRSVEIEPEAGAEETTPSPEETETGAGEEALPDETGFDESGFEDIGVEDDMDFGDEDWG